MSKSKRKPYAGPQRSVERKKKMFKQAIGKILRGEGFVGLGVNKIAAEAGVSKNLMYRYFGNYRNLIEQYGLEIDFWLSSYKASENAKGNEFAILESTLKQLYDHQTNHPEMIKLVLWELHEENYNTATLIRKREELGEHIFATVDPATAEKIDLRAISAILISAIYHLSAHASVHKNATFCGIQVSTEEGRKRIMEAISFLLASSKHTLNKVDTALAAIYPLQEQRIENDLTKEQNKTNS